MRFKIFQRYCLAEQKRREAYFSSIEFSSKRDVLRDSTNIFVNRSKCQACVNNKAKYFHRKYIAYIRDCSFDVCIPSARKRFTCRCVGKIAICFELTADVISYVEFFIQQNAQILEKSTVGSSMTFSFLRNPTYER